MKNTISAPSLCNLTTLRSKRTLNVNVWAVWTTDTIKLFLLLLHAVTTAQQPENYSFEFCSASDWIYCNVDVYKRVSTSVFATTELLYLDMWMGIHKSEKTHCCGDGQIPSEKKKNCFLMVIARPPAHTHREPFDRKFGDEGWWWFFFSSEDIARSSKVVQLPGNEQRLEKLTADGAPPRLLALNCLAVL